MKVYLDSGEDYPVYYFTSKANNYAVEKKVLRLRFILWMLAHWLYGIAQDDIAKVIGDR